MNKSIVEKVLDYFIILAGAALAAFAVECVLVPNAILDGGVTGISIIISALTGWKLSLLILLINSPFLYVGF